MNDLLDILKALSDVTRLRIINLLYVREMCVCDIMESLGITQTKASRHLAYLKNTGLVSDRKQAQWVYYSLAKKDEYRFIDSLVHDKMRMLNQFQEDLKALDDWIQRKNISCN